FRGPCDRRMTKPNPKTFLRPPGRSWKAQDGRPHSCRSKAPHHPQRRSQRAKTVANRLTANTVAHPPIALEARLRHDGHLLPQGEKHAALVGESKLPSRT